MRAECVCGHESVRACSSSHLRSVELYVASRARACGNGERTLRWALNRGQIDALGERKAIPRVLDEFMAAR